MLNPFRWRSTGRPHFTPEEQAILLRYFTNTDRPVFALRLPQEVAGALFEILETQRLMARFAEITQAPYGVAANKQDDPAALPAGTIRQHLRLPAEIPVVPCVATERESCKAVLMALLDEIDRRAVA